MHYSPPPLSRGVPYIITPWSMESIGVELAAMGQATPASSTPTSNLVTYVPFVLGRSAIATEVGWVNGIVATNGNAQVGIYTEDGTQLVECTATTTSGTSVRQTIDITDTTLTAGVRYYMAFRMSSATDRIFGIASSTGLLEAWGVMQQAAQADLPAPATFALNTTALVLPVSYIGITTLF